MVLRLQWREALLLGCKSLLRLLLENWDLGQKPDVSNWRESSLLQPACASQREKSHSGTSWGVSIPVVDRAAGESISHNTGTCSCWARCGVEGHNWMPRRKSPLCVYSSARQQHCHADKSVLPLSSAGPSWGPWVTSFAWPIPNRLCI